jgi:ParB family chromosome partitioning protein
MRGKTKVVKTIIRGHLEGADGREKREGWVPRWMAFPPAAYTARGGVGTVDQARWPLMPAPWLSGDGPDDELPDDLADDLKEDEGLMVLKTPMARMRRMTA